jgi:hypothetical protein
MSDQPNIRAALDQLLANRHTGEARALYTTLARYAHRRVENIARRRYSDILAAPDREDLVAEVLYQLMCGALARFQGTTTGELLAFVRTISDRHVNHAAHKRIRERNTLAGEVGDTVRAWMSREPSPDETVRMGVECPLSEEDAQYLTSLFVSGSRADLARTRGISRAAVTQRLTRIKGRIDALPRRQQSDAKVWIEDLAHRSSEGVLA